jgi:23S rRNA (uridine2552-2'-O)-methyltransferase
MARDSPYKRPDRFTREAKQRGYPARSVFKLEEIDRRVRLLRPGQRVLDLGAAPGSWSMYAAERVGPKGLVVAVDRTPIERPIGPNAKVLQADVLSIDPAELAADGPFAVVLSDMAPSTTGTRSADQAQSFELFARALELAGQLTAPGGSFVGKIFMGPDFAEAKKRVKALFEEQRAIRPEGTRGSSFEIFLVGLRRRPG